MTARAQARKRKALEDHGWVSGNAADLLDLKPEDAQIVELRADFAQAIRRHRRESGWTQTQLAKKLGTTQPKISELEHGIGSIEQMLRAIYVLNGSDTAEHIHRVLQRR